ncbi:HAD family phosphatase [Aurantiacibacter xanthus]|uniref:HAD family phosphatase n=1 Tax=Aurantiacibacter xanthus TaxID=1784712 RepID=A0A3A1PGT6_9SPHN|nr:HAD family phosphatase [Aurantiacibacter xanthus]RIV92850.1 HAD family phosphatase [Aurantiacibacter xanthus]
MSEVPVAAPLAVVWDVGRVLYEWELRHLFARLIDDPAELDWFLDHVVTEEWHFQHDAGRPLAEMVPERQAQFPRHAALIAAYAERFVESIPGPVAGTHQLVEALAARGVPQYGLTNFGAEFWDMFRPTAPIFDLMQDVVVSGRELCVKPDPAIYALLERRSGHDPHELFFIDDRADNVAGARARGWHAHQFDNAAALEAELAAHGLL